MKCWASFKVFELGIAVVSISEERNGIFRMSVVVGKQEMKGERQRRTGGNGEIEVKRLVKVCLAVIPA